MNIFLTIPIFIGMVIFAALTTFVIIVNNTFVCLPDWLENYISPLTKIVISIWIIIAILVGVNQLMSFPTL